MHTEELSFNTWTLEIKASPWASSLSYNPHRLENSRGQGDADFLLNLLHWLIFQDHPPHFPSSFSLSAWSDVLWRNWGGIRILVLPVRASSVEACLEILWQKFTCRIWLSCICSLLHLPRTSDGTKTPGRWAEGPPNASVTTPSLLHHALLPWLAFHSPRADVGP